MNGKVIIYGASGSIGSSVARMLHQEGYDLILVGRSNDRLSMLSQEFDCPFVVGDVRDEDLYSHVSELRSGPLHGLIYAVGTINLGSLKRFKTEDFLTDFSINAVGAARAVQTSVADLKKNPSPASIVLFSSVAATRGFSMHSSMGMAKGAVNGLTLSLAAELSPSIRVNAVAPSITETGLTKKLLDNESVKTAITAQHPLKRYGQPDDVASLVRFLISHDSEWLTGQIIGIDGGRASLDTK